MKAINNNTDKVIQHTKGELRVHYDTYPIGTMIINTVEDNKRICSLNWDDVKELDETKANADRIVKCCNSHNALISTLHTILSNFKINLNYEQTLTKQELQSGINIIEAALKTTE